MEITCSKTVVNEVSLFCQHSSRLENSNFCEGTLKSPLIRVTWHFQSLGRFYLDFYHLPLDLKSNRNQKITEFTEENSLKLFSEVMLHSYNRII